MSEILVILSTRPQPGLTGRRLGWAEAASGRWRLYWREAAASPHLGRWRGGRFAPSAGLLEEFAALEAGPDTGFALLKIRDGESAEAAALRAPGLPRAAEGAEAGAAPERVYAPEALRPY